MIAALFLSAFSALVHLNSCIKLVILRRVALKKRKRALLAMIMSTVARKQAMTRRPTLRRRKRFWVKPGQTDLWWRNMLEGRCVSEDWQKNFRMPKDKFMELVDELRPFISPSPNSLYLNPSFCLLKAFTSVKNLSVFSSFHFHRSIFD